MLCDTVMTGKGPTWRWEVGWTYIEMTAYDYRGGYGERT